MWYDFKVPCLQFWSHHSEILTPLCWKAAVIVYQKNTSIVILDQFLRNTFKNSSRNFQINDLKIFNSNIHSILKNATQARLLNGFIFLYYYLHNSQFSCQAMSEECIANCIIIKSMAYWENSEIWKENKGRYHCCSLSFNASHMNSFLLEM